MTLFWCVTLMFLFIYSTNFWTSTLCNSFTDATGIDCASVLRPCIPVTGTQTILELMSYWEMWIYLLTTLLIIYLQLQNVLPKRILREYSCVAWSIQKVWTSWGREAKIWVKQLIHGELGRTQSIPTGNDSTEFATWRPVTKTHTGKGGSTWWVVGWRDQYACLWRAQDDV